MRMKKGKEVVPKLRFPEFTDSWHNEKLGSIFISRQETGFADLPLMSLTDESGLIPQQDTKKKDNSNVNKSKHLRVCEGDIVYNTMRMWQGRCAYCKNEGIVSPAYTVCVPKDCCDGLFFYYYFKTYDLIRKFHANSQGLVSDTLNLKFDKFASIRINYPIKREEQQKIADCLSSIDELIDAESRKLKALEKYKKGLMQKLFPAEGKTLPEWRFPEFQACGEWKYEEIGNIGEVITGKTPSTSDAALWDGDIQFVTPTDIMENKYLCRTQRSVVKTPKMKVLPKHTIMFTCIASIGKMALSLYPCITNQQINSIIPKSCYDNEFIYYSLLQKTFLIKSGFANSTLPIINKTDFSKIQIPVILDKKEQQKIADFLSEIDTMITEQSNKVEQLKAHKKGLMQGLFPSLEEADV